MRSLCIALSVLFFSACGAEGNGSEEVPADKLFSHMTAAGSQLTGIDFRNDLTYSEALNPYTYRNFFNGGGVGLGDFDRNGYLDIYFTGNLVSNRLYLNEGNWKFTDATQAAGVGCPDTWSTGVAVADVNGDGWDDIYVCKAGPPAGAIAGMSGIRHNELFINQGDGTFTESAAAYGLDIVGLSVHAAFFDYDGDGDLDCYLLNNSTHSTTGFTLQEDLRDIPDPEGGNRLLRNMLIETGIPRFEDVTRSAGIYSSSIGFGLGVTIGDVNLDGRPDIFVSNDFFERDYLYLNSGDGKFDEILPKHLREISKGSMGADLADLNNDGLPELFVTEMLPSDERRYKTKAVFDGWNRYQLYRDNGYHQQFGRNVLQLNRGNGYFSEIGRFSGVEATDWSWGALLADFDGDGHRDIFVANGVGLDLLDQDYINFNGNPEAIRRMINEEGKGITDLIDLIPREPLPDAMFRNDGGLHFTSVAADWGLDEPSFSNGAAYGDLDNDGDLDLVVNRIDAVAGVFRNNGHQSGIMVSLVGRQPGNSAAIGAKLTVVRGSHAAQYAELFPMRGFQSTVDKRLHLSGSVKAVAVRWPDGAVDTFEVEQQGPVVELHQLTTAEDLPAEPSLTESASFRSPSPGQPLRTASGPIVHQEDDTRDFDRDALLFLGVNNEGPALAVGDVTGDGRPDLYMGGAAGQSGRLLRALPNGDYADMAVDMLAEDAASENVDAIFLDVDADGDLDLYVANGSNAFGPASSALLDRIYLNQGGGVWERGANQMLPVKDGFVTSGCVSAHDINGDGYTDLFVGGRLRPGVYGVPADSYLLLNDGTGQFSADTLTELRQMGLVTASVWADVDGDLRKELIIAEEWGPIRYLYFDDRGRLTDSRVLPNTEGLWHALAAADFDGDGRMDVAAGNHGLNSRLRASPERPLELHINDFDGNGRAEQILTQPDDHGRARPIVLRDDLVKQIPSLRKRVGRYADYQGKALSDLFDSATLQRSVVRQAVELRSLVIYNTAAGTKTIPLPQEAQYAPVYTLFITDLDDDGRPDLLAAGNQSVGRPETGIYEGGFGAALLNRGDGEFTSLPPRRTGLYLTGDVRKLAELPGTAGSRPRVLVARSNDTLQTYELQPYDL